MFSHVVYLTPAGAICTCGAAFATTDADQCLAYAAAHLVNLETNSGNNKIEDLRPKSEKTSVISMEYMFSNRTDPERVLSSMKDIIQRYGYSSLADLHDLIGLPSTYSDNKKIWDSVDEFVIREIDTGFALNTSPPKEILLLTNKGPKWITSTSTQSQTS